MPCPPFVSGRAFRAEGEGGEGVEVGVEARCWSYNLIVIQIVNTLSFIAFDKSLAPTNRTLLWRHRRTSYVQAMFSTFHCFSR